ncbi:MAG TPA: ferredoxin [Methanobacterium sp.]|nr:ferredoxin [Methanobacterium sp.]
MVKVEIEREMCISCGNCIDSCPQYFEFAEDGFSTLIGGHSVGDNVELEIDDAGCTVIAEENCPVSIIHVYE